MKCLCVLVFAVVILACAVEPVAGQDGAATAATATPTTTLHPATACIEDLRAIASARVSPSLTPGADSGGVTPTAGTPTPTAEPGNEVTTALSVEIVNAVPRLTGVVTLETATATRQIAILRQRTPGHPAYRTTLIDLLSSDSNIGPNVGPFGRGAALGMVDSLREPPLLTVDGDVATLTFLLPFDASVLAYSDDAQIPFDPWNVVTAGRDLIFRLEGGDDIPPTTTWWVATCFDGLDVVSIGDASDADASSAPIPTSPSGFGPFSPTPVASYLMPIVSDGPDRLLWKLSASTPREERVVAPRVRPNLITEFRLWLSTDWRWPLAAAWEYAGHFLIVLIPLAILWPLSRSGQSDALSAVLRRYRIASAAILVLLAIGLITTGVRAVILLESSDQSGPASSPKGVTVDDGAGTADDGSMFAAGTDARLDRTDVPAPVRDRAYLPVPLNASDLSATGERQPRVIIPHDVGKSHPMPLQIEADPACADQLKSIMASRLSAGWLDGEWSSFRNTAIIATIVASLGVFALAARWLRVRAGNDVDGMKRWRDWTPGVLGVLGLILVVLLGRTSWPLGVLAGVVPFAAAGLLIFGIIQLLMALWPASTGSASLSRVSDGWVVGIVIVATTFIVLQWAGWVSYHAVSLWAWLSLSEDPLWSRWGIFTDPCAAMVALADPRAPLGGFAGNMRPLFINFPESFLVSASRLLPFVVLVGVFGVLDAASRATQERTPVAPKRVRWAIAFLFAAFVVGYGSVLGFQFPIRLWLAMGLLLLVLRRVPLLDRSPRDDWWTNGVLAAQHGAVLAIVPVAYYLYILATAQIDQYISRQVPFGAATVLVGLASEISFWIVAAFTLGSLYPFLRGHTGPLKALLLSAVFVGAYLPSLFGPDVTEYPWLVRAFQLALFLIALSAWLDLDARRSELSIESLSSLYNLKTVKSVAGYVAPAVALIGTVVNQLQTGDAKNAILAIAQHVTTQLPAP